MMWHTALSNSKVSSEPIELRALKQQLANVSCNCKTCFSASDPMNAKLNNLKDIEVQAERYVSVETKGNYSENNIKDALCPTCCMTLSILRGGVVRVLKDQESETLTSMFSVDKSIGKKIKSQEKTTSVGNKPISEYSNLTLCDFMSDDGSSELAVSNLGSPVRDQNHRKRYPHDRVTFLDSPYQSRSPEETGTKPTGAHCVCLEDFIDSIRPPASAMSRY